MSKHLRKILLCMSLIMIFMGACKSKSSPTPSPTPTPTPDTALLGKLQEDEAITEKLQELKTRNPVLSSVVNEFIVKYQAEGHTATIDWAREQRLLDVEDNLVLTVILDTADVTIIQDFNTQAEGYGVTVLGYLGNEIELLIPLAVIEDYATSDEMRDTVFDDLAALEHVENIKFTAYMGPMGRIESEGVQVLGADQWHAQGYRGQNVKVGIIDYGFDGYRDLLGTELPATVVAQSFALYNGVDNAGSVHGTAVGEIIHDLAPAAELYFACIDGSASSFARGARWLADQGVAIINHSGGFPFGPFDGTNSRDKLVDEISDRGILWVNSAGNDGGAHWRGMFQDTDGDGYHNFTHNLNRIPIWGTRGVQLHWWPNPGEDYDVYVFNAVGLIMAQSIDDQKNGSPPLEETARFPMIQGINYYVAIKAEQNATPIILDLFVSNGAIQDSDFIIRDYSVTNPATSLSSLSVGATWWSDDALTIYSSGGPTGDGRLKPDLSAPTEVQNSSYAAQGFGGTSAAAPHVAGAAALVLGAYPDMSAPEIRSYLLDHARDLGASGADNAYGYGRVQLPPRDETAPPATVAATPADASPTLTATPTPSPVPTAQDGILATAGALLSTEVLPTAEAVATEIAPTVQAFVTDILPTVAGKVTEFAPTIKAVLGTVTSESDPETDSENTLWIVIIVVAVLVLIVAVILMWVVFRKPARQPPQPAVPPSPPHVLPHTPLIKGETTVPAPALFLSTANGKRYPLLPGTNTIGRASDCTVHIPDTQMSRHHTRLRVSATEIIVEDTSTNGTFVNTRRISTPTRLEVHDSLRCGQTVFTLLSQQKEGMISMSAQSGPQAFLQIKNRDRISLMTQPNFTIGRSSQNNIVLRDEKASRRHARVEWQNDNLYLVDLGSSGGTLVNGRRIHQHPLQNGDSIQMGTTILTFIQDAAYAPPRRAVAANVPHVNDRAPMYPQNQGAAMPVNAPPQGNPQVVPARQISIETQGDSSIALWLEILFGIFGLLGVGHIYTGRIGLGIALMIGWWLYIGVAGTFSAATLGIMGCLLGPIYLLGPIISGIQARTYMQQKGGTGSWSAVGMIAGGGCLLAIVAIVILVVALGGFGVLLNGY